jgi:hypothetical protein
MQVEVELDDVPIVRGERRAFSRKAVEETAENALIPSIAS